MNTWHKTPESTDFLIMRLRTLAHLRGATPVEIQKNVESLETGDFPEKVKIGLRAQYIDFDSNYPDGSQEQYDSFDSDLTL